ncbi:DNA (cytosine-5-)-methyltransferase [Quadrisphaera sp. GCM10027208]|uniref:DNA (cytosine-5-)-methyltransferase n=1 Tax=Quadrisphaera sp. GCM10027208 TaxID=3273423 RepID=UPI00360CE820
MSFGFVDLFAGIGGFHAALTALGGRALLASEIDPYPASVYARNWGVVPHGDVTALAEDAEARVPEHQVLAGGFPCQPFSKSGRQLGMAELRGRLFNEILRILEARKPPVVVLENVRNIAGPRQRTVWEAVLDGLRHAGYRVPQQPCVFSPHLLHPDRGGSPQVRDRVYILGTYVGTKRALTETDVDPVVQRRPVDGWDPHKWDLERHVLQEEHEILARDTYSLSETEQEWVAVWNDFLARTQHVQLPGFPLWSFYWHDDAVVDEAAPLWKQAIERKNINFYRENRQAIRGWLRANPEVRSFPPSRQKLEWQAQDAVRDLRACLLHFRPSGIRAKKPTYAPALVAIAQTPVVGPRLRKMTPREAARLQGFPDWFDFGGQPVGLTYKQLGNAVHVGAAYYVLVQHLLRDKDDLLDQPGGVELVTAAETAPLAPVLRPHSQ